MLAACGSSGPADAGPPVSDAECVTSADCVDEVSCNGVERCDAGRCEPGEPVGCADELACTADSCAEPFGDCWHVRSDDACEAGSTCTASSGTGCEATCSETPCRYASPQCGCPAGDSCYLDTSNGTPRCLATGLFGRGARCSTFASCQRGLACVGLGTDTPRCARYCESDADCGGGELERCLISLTKADGTPSGAFVCTEGCDPLQSGACPEGQRCIIAQRTERPDVLGTVCATGANGGLDAPCEDDVDCGEGLTCFQGSIESGMGQRCRATCTFPDPICPSGGDCVSFEPVRRVGDVELGVCAVR